MCTFSIVNGISCESSWSLLAADPKQFIGRPERGHSLAANIVQRISAGSIRVWRTCMCVLTADERIDAIPRKLSFSILICARTGLPKRFPFFIYYCSLVRSNNNNLSNTWILATDNSSHATTTNSHTKTKQTTKTQIDFETSRDLWWARRQRLERRGGEKRETEGGRCNDH